MRILILNQILYTADNNTIPVVSSIKDTMIYGMCLGFVNTGHTVTLAASEEYKPQSPETYDFTVRFFSSDIPRIFAPSILPFSSELYRFIKREQANFDLVISSEVFSFQSLFAAILCPRKTLIWHRTPKKIPSAAVKNLVPNDRPAVPEKSPADYSQIEARLRFHQILPAQCYGYGIGPRDKRR